MPRKLPISLVNLRVASSSPPTMLGRPMRRFTVLVAALVVLVVPRLAFAKTSTKSVSDPLKLELEGSRAAYYYKPRAQGMKPVLMYMHGRGGNPLEDCRKWAHVATQFGWVVCPQGPGQSDSGGRTWANGAGDAQKIADASVAALREKYKRRVQLRGNVLIGFSEGAFVAMNVGMKDQRTWNRWLILGASDAYWGGNVNEAFDPEKRKVRRVYLLTGENDGVAENTKRVGETLKKNKVPVKVKLVPGMGHEVPGDRMVSTYRRPLAWLVAAK